MFQSDPPQKSDKARLRSQIRVERIHLEIESPNIAVVAALLQPGQGLAAVAQSQVDHRDAKRANVALFTRVLQVHQNFPRFGRFTKGAPGMTQHAPRPCAATRVLHRFAELSERQVVLARGNIDFAQKPNSGNETLILIKFAPFTQLLLGFVELSRW